MKPTNAATDVTMPALHSRVAALILPITVEKRVQSLGGMKCGLWSDFRLFACAGGWSRPSVSGGKIPFAKLTDAVIRMRERGGSRDSEMATCTRWPLSASRCDL
jgi:hypothetical protein